MKVDANSILREHGPDVLREAFEHAEDPLAGEKSHGNGAAEGSKSKSLGFVLFDDIKDVPKHWTVAKFIGSGDAGVLYGEPGCGKSVLAEDLGLHVAAGLPWHGRAVLQGAVLYIAMERFHLVKRRAVGFGIKHNVRGLPFAVVGGAVNFRNSKTAPQIVEIIRAVERATRQKVVLIIVDTVSRALCGGDENSSKDMGELIGTVGDIQAATDAALLLLHHVPHEGDRMRGHGNLLGAVDTTIHVQKGVVYRTATVIKANDAHEGERLGFNLESIGLPSGAQAPIVAPVDLGPPQSASVPASKKLNPNQRRFVDILQTAITELPADRGAMGVPSCTQAVTRENLKKYCVSMGWIEEAETNKARATISNMLNALAGKHVVGTTTQYVWLTS